MLTKSAITFGIVFLIIGVLGFFPGATPNGMLLGLFHVNPAHNWVHILSGLIALGCASAGVYASRMYFQIFGVIYGLVAVLGLFTGQGYVLGFLANNGADVVLHLAIAVVALYLGFGYVRESPPRMAGV